MNEFFCPARPEHGESIVFLLSDADKRAMGQFNGAHVSARVKESTVSWCCTHDGKPMCVGGVVKNGLAWMIATPELNRHKKFFLRTSLIGMKIIRAAFPSGTAMVDITYVRSIRWLKWLGFVEKGTARRSIHAGMCADVQTLEWGMP